ncbi:MAG: hypothetical protein IRY91_11110 [Gemmatimonadaceae bacterium]|nr:hypothetical protein [Gemmatimonadaceae bacterium]
MIRRSSFATLVAALCALVALGAASTARAQSDTTDPRAHLKAGLYDAGVAAKGLRLVAHRNKPEEFHPNDPGGLTYANSDMAFGGRYLYQGNFSGLQIWDIADPRAPKLTNVHVCFTEQGDVSIYGHLLFVSAEDGASRLDCGTQGVQDSVSKERMIGVRIFDVSDPTHPRQVATVQTCRGSHTHTLVPDPHDKGVVYIYVSGLAPVRSASELPGCEAGDITDPNTALFRIEVIKVPLAHPEQAAIVSSPRIFNDLTPPPTHGVAVADTANGAAVKMARGFLQRVQLPATTAAADSEHIAELFATFLINRSSDTARARVAADSLRQYGINIRMPSATARRSGPSQCHDITVYPAIGLAAGACSGYGLLLDIKDPAHPTRLQAVSDSNFAFWHSATFSNDGSKLLFTDEWGGGTQAKCRATDPIEWGADVFFTLANNTLTHAGYFKMPAAQTEQENCVAHNGSLIPVPGRDIMVQAWYQGGLSVFDFTDPTHPKEIAYFDRGPIDSTELVLGGYWSGYYYNGYIYGSAIARGLDVFELTPTADLTQNEIDAAKLVHLDVLNPQDQPKIVWPAAFPVARAYVDQLVRDHGLPEARTSAITSALNSAEHASGAARRRTLEKLAAELDRDAQSASDAKRVRALADVVRGLERAAR